MRRLEKAKENKCEKENEQIQKNWHLEASWPVLAPKNLPKSSQNQAKTAPKSAHNPLEVIFMLGSQTYGCPLHLPAIPAGQPGRLGGLPGRLGRKKVPKMDPSWRPKRRQNPSWGPPGGVLGASWRRHVADFMHF